MMHKPDIIDIFGIIIQLFAWIFCIPYILTNLYHLHIASTKNDIAKSMISEREWPLLITLNILCIFEFLINRPFVLSMTVWFPMDISRYIPLWVIVLIYTMFWIAILMLYALRTWKLHYKQQLNIAIYKKLWEKKINENSQNWYIINQHKYYLNNYNLLKILLPIYIILISVGPILQSLVTNLNDSYTVFVHIFNFFWIFLPLIVGLIIFTKSKNIIDRFGIRNEFKFQTIFLWIILTIYVIESALFNSKILLKTRTNTPSQDDIIMFIRIEYILYSINAVTLNCVLSLTSTIYPLRLIKKIISGKDPIYPEQKLKYSKINTDSTLPSDQMTELTDIKSGSTTITNATQITTEEDILSINDDTIPLVNILSNEIGFRLFMKHLITEFATGSYFTYYTNY